MDDRQNRFFTMAETVKELLDDHEATITYPAALNNRRTELNGILAQIPETKQDQELDTTGITDNKEDLKADMALTAWTVGRPLHLWALDNNKKELAAKINFTYSDLRYSADTDAYTRSDLIYEEASDPAVDLSGYGVDPATIAAVQTKALIFAAAIGTPGAAEALKVAATEALEKQFFSLGETLAAMDDLMAPFRVSEPDFYSAYLNARKQDTTSVRHISIRGKVTHAGFGSLITRGTVTATAPDGSVTQVSLSALGNFRIFSKEPNAYTLTIASPGFVTKVVEGVVVNPGEITVVDVQLEEA